MNELNEDIDQLFRDVVEPSEMQPSQSVWNTIDKRLDKTQYNKLQLKYGRVFNFSIGISVVVISLVFLILNQNTKKNDAVLEKTINTTQPVTASVVEADANATGPSTTESENKVVTNSANKVAENSIQKSVTTASSVPKNNFPVTNKTENTNSNTNSKNNSPATVVPASTNVNSSLPASAIHSTASTIATENSVSSPETTSEKKSDAVKPSVDEAVVKATETYKTISENTQVSENEKQNSSTENKTQESTTNNSTDVVELKPATEENNNLNAASSENNTQQSTVPSTTEASLTNEPIVKNEELLNASATTSSENKTEEVKNNSSANDTASAVKNTNDTATSAAKDAANNPLNGLIPLKDFKFYVAGYYSPEKLMTNLIDANPSSNSLDEKNNFAFSTGLKIGYNINKKWSLSTALIYSSVSSSFNFNKTIDSRNDDNVVEGDEITNYTLSTSSGTIDIPVTNSIYHPNTPNLPYETAELTLEGKEKLKYISVPIECQYTLGKNRFTGFISLGVTANFLISQKTDITELNTEMTYNPHIDGLRSAYFSAGLGVGIQYRIWQRLSVFIEPTYRQGITPLNKDVPIKTYPSLFGVSGGLAFHF